MARRKFEEGGNNLPVGSHSPCQLLSIKRHEPSDEVLQKWPDMKPSLCFRFMLYKPDDAELHKATGVRFCTDTVSKLGKLYEFATDLCGGEEPESFDEDDYVGEWFRISIRKKPKSPDKLHVTSAEPIDAPKDVPNDWSESAKSTDGVPAADDSEEEFLM